MADAKTSAPKATHPKYSEMIATAIETLKEKGGSSRVAIIKFITSKYTVSDNSKVVNSQLKLSLKKGVDSGALVQVKGTGASGSFKLAKKAAGKPVKTAKKANIKSPKKVKTKKAGKSPKKVVKSSKTFAKSSKKPKAVKSPKNSKSLEKVAKPKKVSSKTAAKPKVKKPAAKKPTKK